MKILFYSLLLFFLCPLCVPAGNLAFLGDYNALLKIEKPELRVSKILDMMDKYPEFAAEIFPLFNENVRHITPEFAPKAEAIRQKYPENLLINYMINYKYPFEAKHIPAIKEMLLNCPVSAISETQ